MAAKPRCANPEDRHRGGLETTRRRHVQDIRALIETGADANLETIFFVDRLFVSFIFAVVQTQQTNKRRS